MSVTVGGRLVTPIRPANLAAQWAGFFKVAGQTTLGGSPFRAAVYLFPAGNMNVVLRSAYTDSSGNFLFSGLAAGLYMVIATDATNAYNSVVYNIVQAVGM